VSEEAGAKPKDTVESEAEAPYEMANLTPRMTGLPMVVWVSHRGRARHDVRVKVQQTHGRRMALGNSVSVAVRPAPHLVAGHSRRPICAPSANGSG